MLYCPICSAEIDEYPSPRACWNCSTVFGVWTPVSVRPSMSHPRVDTNRASTSWQIDGDIDDQSLGARRAFATILFVVAFFIFILAKMLDGLHGGWLYAPAVLFCIFAAIVLITKGPRVIPIILALSILFFVLLGVGGYLIMRFVGAAIYQR